MPLASAAAPLTASPELHVRAVRQALAEARDALGMDAAFFAELSGEWSVVRAVEGDAAAFGIAVGDAVALQETYCARMIAGELACWVPSTLENPITRLMPITAQSGIGAYAGVPVRRPDGRIFGSFCCISRAPRPELDARDIRLLSALATVVSSQLEHEHRYHEVLERAEEPVWVTDLEGRTVFANQPLAELLRQPRDELVGVSSMDYVPPSEHARVRTALALRDGGRSGRYEVLLQRRDGSTVPVEIVGAPLTDDGGEVIGRIATLNDLTQRREAERLLDTRFRWLADLVPQQVWIADRDGGIDFVNARVEEYYGEGAELSSNSSWRAFLHPDDLPAVEAIQPARAAGKPYSFTARIRRHDGEYREHRASAHPMLDEQGEVLRWYGVTTDLTDAQAQERLLTSEARLREAQRIAQVGSFEWDSERGRMEYSDELLRLLEFTPEAFGGRVRAFVERVEPEDGDLVERLVRRAAESGESYAFDVRLTLPSGTPRTVQTQGRIVMDPDGRLRSMAGTVQDVTEQRAAEEAGRARLAAERASLAKSEFLSRMSHELRTPLNAILGFGQLLELDPLTPEQHESVGHVLKAGAHLLELIDEVLEISRIEAGALRLSLEPVGIAETVADVVALIAPLAAERGVGVAVDRGPDPGVHVHADLQRVKQVLLNLLSNAIKYNREGGQVTVRIGTAPEGGTSVVISDTGLGLRPEDLERAFSPFERLGADQGATQGTGLGLALSRSLAEAMGGTLTAASEPGCGCDLTLVLATAAAPAAEPPALAAPSAGQVPADAAAAGPRARVLCIEDNPANLRLVERVLTRAGIEVLGAPQGRLGIELARRHRPDLVLLDLDLPDVSGEIVLSMLTADPATQDVPVLICSADANPATQALLEDAGAAGYLTKPLGVAGLLKAVASLTDGALSA